MDDKLETIDDIKRIGIEYKNGLEWVRFDDLKSLGKIYIKYYEKMMEKYDIQNQRELYLLYAGKRGAIMKIFDLD